MPFLHQWILRYLCAVSDRTVCTARYLYTLSDSTVCSLCMFSDFLSKFCPLFCRKRIEKSKPLSTNEIADQLEELEENDDSDRDPDYKDREEESSTSSSSDSESEDEGEGVAQKVNRRVRREEEIRVYMNPPQERADGDTDKDSGNFFQINQFYVCFCLKFHYFFVYKRYNLLLFCTHIWLWMVGHSLFPIFEKSERANRSFHSFWKERKSERANAQP